jgi:hypothetical protein
MSDVTVSKRSRFLEDASRRSSDPTNTGRVRRAFRAEAAMRLRRLSAEIRKLVIDHDVLALGQNSVLGFHPAQVRLDAFGHSVHAAMMGMVGGDWTRVFLQRAWQDGVAAAVSETGAAAAGAEGDDEFEGLMALTRREVDGIGAAIEQRLARVADVIIAASAHQRITPVRAFRRIQAELTKVAGQRLPLLADTAPVLACTRALINVYRQTGIEAVGVEPESGAVRVMADAAPVRRNPPTPMERYGELREKAVPKAYAKVEFVGVRTAGDNFVCERCEDAADDAPYTLAEYIGLFPMHPRCRCRPRPWFDKRYAGDRAPRLTRNQHTHDFHRWWQAGDAFGAFDPQKHPHAPSGQGGGQFQPTGGGRSATRQRDPGARVRGGALHSKAQEARHAVGEFMKTHGKQAIHEVGHALHEHQREILAGAITFALYHVAGADFPEDVADGLRDQIIHFSENAQVSRAIAKDYFHKATDALIKLHGKISGTKDAADDDPVRKALQLMKRALDDPKIKQLNEE